ncbi:hypothetical protein U9M48_010923 [Paspalum notatum var. saurae]|uniref:Uncharacterized protein n=1 Tax=Paspalum notatum var. saurae TaxID=547442 RepID=A0AAQ3SU76_PASNO
MVAGPFSRPSRTPAAWARSSVLAAAETPAPAMTGGAAAANTSLLTAEDAGGGTLATAFPPSNPHLLLQYYTCISLQNTFRSRDFQNDNRYACFLMDIHIPIFDQNDVFLNHNDCMSIHPPISSIYFQYMAQSPPDCPRSPSPFESLVQHGKEQTLEVPTEVNNEQDDSLAEAKKTMDATQRREREYSPVATRSALGVIGKVKDSMCALLLLLFLGFLGEEDHCARSNKDEDENRYYKMDKTGWESWYPNNLASMQALQFRSICCDVFTVFDMRALAILPNMGGLLDPRSAIMYHLLTMKGNKGDIPLSIRRMIDV